jgi:hypothetical protein
LTLFAFALLIGIAMWQLTPESNYEKESFESLSLVCRDGCVRFGRLWWRRWWHAQQRHLSR